MSFSSYKAGEKPDQNWHDYTLLASNENPLGPSKQALAAIKEGLKQVHRYPDSHYAQLRARIAATHNLDPDRVITGCGSDELIGLLIHRTRMIEPQASVLISRIGFSMYEISAANAGLKCDKANTDNFKISVEELLDCVHAQTRLCFIANPNNPTGHFLEISELARLREALPKEVLLVIDEAYIEYADQDAKGCLAEQLDHTVVLRTFSKFFGLAGLRLGWGFFPHDLAQDINRLRNPFTVNILATQAAIAALDDTKHQKKCFKHNLKWRSWLIDNLASLGLQAQPSQANFLLINCLSPARATAIYEHLKKSRVMVRRFADEQLECCLRASIGTQAENCTLIEHIKSL